MSLEFLSARVVKIWFGSALKIETIVLLGGLINKLKSMNKIKDKKPQVPEGQPERKPLRQPGGTYFYAGAIIGRKNVFVTNEYLDLMVNAFKMTEVRKDIKNLAYVVMPNFFYWIFQLSPKQDDPVAIYSEVKKDVAREIWNNLQTEAKGQPYPLLNLFKTNDRVSRSVPQKVLWTFEEMAKKFEGNKRYRVWAPKTEIRLLDNEELLKQKLAVIKKAPVSERWQLVAKAEEYPYLYLSEEVQDIETLVGAAPALAKTALSVGVTA